jgi:hypothetical protein
VFNAFFYLQYHSLRNRTWQRLKRLKQPKYLLGGIVGGLYFYFYFFRYLFSSGRSGGTPPIPMPFGGDSQLLYEAFSALLLLIVVLAGWIFPRERAALTFSEAEVAFLFPAPVSRRNLIHYKLLRSQAGILFTSLILLLIARRSSGNFWVHAVGWWLVLSTLNLHFLGASFVRTMLLDRGITHWQRRWAVLGVVGLVAAGVGVWAWRSLPAPDWQNMQGAASAEEWFRAVFNYLQQVVTTGPLPYFLYPCRLLVRPYLAGGGGEFWLALLPALAVLGLHYVWVIRSDVTFEEASVEASRKLADKVAAVRAGKWGAAGQVLKGRRPPFRLSPTGVPAVAFIWKNLISAGNAGSWRLWVGLAIGVGAACLGLRPLFASAPVSSAIGVALAMLVFWSLLLGPQFLRQDFRQDLPMADVLKGYPMRGWQIAAGELLGPAIVLTLTQWLLFLLGGFLLLQHPPPVLGRAGVVGLSLGAVLVAPMLNVITLQIPNAAVLLFPAWFQAGKEGMHGIEATGQRIIILLGQVLVFLATLLPAALASAAVFLLVKWFLGLPLAIVAASITASLVLLAEAIGGLFLLGWFFERLDLSSESVG